MCDPNLFLLLPLLARPHRHAPILQTKPVDTSTLSAHESELAPRTARMDFLVLPLTLETVPEIEKAIVSKVAFKDYAGIVHVQIERQGRLAFVACDHFHEDCVWVSEAVPETFLAELVKNRVLYSYAPA
jgi:hypothetical protein